MLINWLIKRIQDGVTHMSGVLGMAGKLCPLSASIWTFWHGNIGVVWILTMAAQDSKREHWSKQRKVFYDIALDYVNHSISETRLKAAWVQGVFKGDVS